MSKDHGSDRVEYLAQASSWAQDRFSALEASRRTAWIVALAAVIVAICEAIAIVALTPLKRIEPYTLLVDRQTGSVQALKPLQPQLISGDTALVQSFLVQYVIAREGFDIDALQDDYRKVAIWSVGSARSDYLTSMPASNPESPLARYPRTTTIDVVIKSITPLANQVALVRFDTNRHDAGQLPVSRRLWVSVVSYSFANRPMTVADRYINPLGFQVLRYRRSAEALPPPRSLEGSAISSTAENGDTAASSSAGGAISNNRGALPQ